MQNARTAVMMFAALLPVTARAQEFGRWSWQAEVSWLKSGSSSLVDDVEVHSTDRGRLNLRLGVKGFILHPYIARFALTINARGESSGESGHVSQRPLGGSGTLEILPKSNYPARVSFSHESSRYLLAEDIEPTVAARLSKSVRSASAETWFRGGALRGTSLQLSRLALDYPDPTVDSTTTDRALLNWSRGNHEAQHVASLRYLRSVFGPVGLSEQSLEGSFDRRSRGEATWKWDARVWANELEREYGGRPFRLQRVATIQQLSRRVGSANQLYLSYSGRLSRSEAAWSPDHELRARYDWRRSRKIYLSPALAYRQATFGVAHVEAPNGSVDLTYLTGGGPLEATLMAKSGLALVKRSAPDGITTERVLTLGASASLIHRRLAGMRAELDLGWGRNSLQLNSDAEGPLSILATQPGAHDNLTARLSLHRSFGRTSLTAEGQLEKRVAASGFDLGGSTFETRRGTLTLGRARASVSAGAGSSVGIGFGGDRATYKTLTVNLLPMRSLTLQAGYRSDQRDRLGVPRSDRSRFDASAMFSLGRIHARAVVFSSRERGGVTNGNKGFTLSLSYRLAGWLPFVTGGIPLLETP